MKAPHFDKREAFDLYRSVWSDYDPAEDLFDENDERARWAKWAVRTALEPWERVLLILYCEIPSLRNLADALEVSKTTLLGMIRAIRRRLRVQLRTDGHTDGAPSDTAEPAGGKWPKRVRETLVSELTKIGEEADAEPHGER